MPKREGANNRIKEKRDSRGEKSESEGNKNETSGISVVSFPGHCSLHFPLHIQTLYAHVPFRLPDPFVTFPPPPPPPPLSLSPCSVNVCRVLDACFSLPRVCKGSPTKGKSKEQRANDAKRMLNALCTV